MNRRQALAMMAGALLSPRPAWSRAASRPFRLGVTRWPPDLTLAALSAVERFIRDACDLAAPTLFGGVPWPEAAEGRPFSAAIEADLSWRPPDGHAFLVSVNMLDDGRSGLAPYWGERDNQPIPEPFAGRPFDDPLIMSAYAGYCLRVCERLRPDWFVVGIEMNILLHKAPAQWPALKTLYRATYEAVKAAFPQVQCCFSIEALHFLGQAEGADAALQRREMIELLEFSDVAAFSIYPHMSWGIPRPLPEDFFDFARDLAEAAGGKPIGISESGYTSRDVDVGGITLFGSPEDQRRHLDLLLRAAERDRYEFVVNFASHDYPRLTAALPEPARTLANIWTYTGLVDGDGGAKPATEIWRRALAMPYGR